MSDDIYAVIQSDINQVNALKLRKDEDIANEHHLATTLIPYRNTVRHCKTVTVIFYFFYYFFVKLLYGERCVIIQYEQYMIHLKLQWKN